MGKPLTNEERGARIKEARLARKMSQGVLGEKLGVKQPPISEMERGMTKSTELYDAAEIELGLRTSPSHLGVPPSDPSRPVRIMATQEKEKGIAVMTDVSIGSIPRPYELGDVSDAYAFHVPNSDMSPIFRPGILLIIHPHLPPSTEDCVILYGEGKRFLIREFVRMTTDNWFVRFYGEKPSEEILSRADYPSCHTVWGTQRK